jgi:hypothetical protein
MISAALLKNRLYQSGKTEIKIKALQLEPSTPLHRKRRDSFQSRNRQKMLPTWPDDAVSAAVAPIMPFKTLFVVSRIAHLTVHPLGRATHAGVAGQKGIYAGLRSKQLREIFM